MAKINILSTSLPLKRSKPAQGQCEYANLLGMALIRWLGRKISNSIDPGNLPFNTDHSSTFTSKVVFWVSTTPGMFWPEMETEAFVLEHMTEIHILVG